MQFIKETIGCVRKKYRRLRWDRRRLARERRYTHDLPQVLESVERAALQDGLNRAPRTPRIIVSLASYPPRFSKLDLVLRRLLDQTLKPDRLILNLDDSIKPEDVPEAVRALTRFGLEIRYCPNDLKPHKKYFFAMQEHPDDVVVTVDDDTIYPRNLVETLVASFRRFPDCVSAIRAHKITFDRTGAMRPYMRWTWACAEVNHPSMRYVATGGCGILYPPRVIPPEAFDVGAIRETSLNNDDLWLKFMQMRTGSKVVICGRDVLKNCLEIQETQRVSLRTDNVNHGANDRCFQLLLAREGRTAADFKC